ncbi:hypothetical protein Fmac_011131 [Flemingia macrophylla]|uniref:Disease resistance protein At4g27190-like leucine-rich repeats domain-containing protein n=1 Tax=Flemingia macrophylla TaxID=520843 RepID=A0ABD1MLK4_9FABA
MKGREHSDTDVTLGTSVERAWIPLTYADGYCNALEGPVRSSFGRAREWQQNLAEQMLLLETQVGIADKRQVDKIMMTSFKLADIKEDTISVLELPEINKLLLEDLPNLISFSLGEIVEWPSLDNVGVNNCPNLKMFGLGKIKISKIKPVITENMEKLDIDSRIAYLFEPWDDKLSMMIEYAIDEDYKLNRAIDNIRPSHFTNLVRFQAKNCGRNLTKFLSILMKRSNKLEFIKIENGTLNCVFDIASLRSYKDGDGIYLTEMKELELIGLRTLDLICNANPYGTLDLKNLQKVHIKSCPRLYFIFYSQGADRLYQLMELKLEACNMLNKVIHHNAKEELGIRFLALRKVEFKSLSEFEMFYYHHLEFPNLQTLMIQDCPKLIKFTTGFATANAVDTIDDKSFSELNELQLDNCIRLVFVIHSKTLQEFRNLKKLIVTHCGALKTVFHIDGEIPESSELLQQLDELTLTYLPNLTRIVNREISMFCQHLQILQVKQCESLKMLSGSLMLKNIEIHDCKALEKVKIINEKEGTKGIFSQLKDVSLKNLTMLSSAFSSTYEFPSLEILKIANCPAMMTFVEESNEVKIFSESAISNCFFPNSVSLNFKSDPDININVLVRKQLLLDKLKILHIVNQDIEKLWQYDCPQRSFCELENLTLNTNRKMLSVISLSMIERFNKLKKMILHKCELLIDLFNLEDDKTNHNIREMFPQLRELALSNLNKLESVWSKEPQVPFFLKLESLCVVHCNSLKSLFILSSAKNLGNLRLLKLNNCEKIKEVISSDINEDEKASFSNDLLPQNKTGKVQVNISKKRNKRKQKDMDENEMFPFIFPKIERLVLKDLPKFVSFHQKNQTFNWPNLKMVTVKNIPNVETFSGGIINAPLLRSVYITFVKKLWLGNLKNTILYINDNIRYVIL